MTSVLALELSKWQSCEGASLFQRDSGVSGRGEGHPPQISGVRHVPNSSYDKFSLWIFILFTLSHDYTRLSYWMSTDRCVCYGLMKVGLSFFAERDLTTLSGKVKQMKLDQQMDRSQEKGWPWKVHFTPSYFYGDIIAYNLGEIWGIEVSTAVHRLHFVMVDILKLIWYYFYNYWWIYPFI